MYFFVPSRFQSDRIFVLKKTKTEMNEKQKQFNDLYENKKQL